MGQDLSRRGLLRGIALGFGASAMSPAAEKEKDSTLTRQANAAIQLVPVPEERTLSFRVARSWNKKTNEVYYHDDHVHNVTYYKDGAYDPEALAEINHILRDRKAGDVPPREINIKLLDHLNDFRKAITENHPEFDGVFHVISGDRRPKTNAELISDKTNPTRGSVASNSRHIYSSAIDLFVPDLEGYELRNIAWNLGRGSVGTYPEDHFPPYPHYIHMDTRGLESKSRRYYWGFDPRDCGGPAAPTLALVQ